MLLLIEVVFLHALGLLQIGLEGLASLPEVLLAALALPLSAHHPVLRR